VLEDYVGGRLSPPAGDPARLAHLLAGRQVVDLAGWKAIDERERALGRAQSSPRVKICSVDQMLAVAAGEAVPTG
jgi:ferredoxin--NADP+ reductase